MVAGNDLRQAIGHTLVLTAHMDGRAFAFFDEQRRRNFPPALNRVPAHITLFHTLPELSSSMVRHQLECVSRESAAIPVQVAGPKGLGNGVAYGLKSPSLSALHRDLQEAFQPFLTEQDRRQFWPHVTVQNKVPASVAERLVSELRVLPYPKSFQIVGLQLWRYCNGPWEKGEHFAFKS